MGFDYFENAVNTNMNSLPNTMYRNLMQAFVNEEWDNTAVEYNLQEQDMVVGQFESFTFHNVEAWINYVVGQTSTGIKNGDDFRQLTFRCLDHHCIRGRYYKFDDNYWMGYFTDNYDGLVQSMTIRRCNNFLRIVDPENGAVFSAPCIVDYDMSSPSVQVSSHLITPNNHAIVMVQGNADTIRLFKTNTRYILGGRPFKLNAYQNAINDDLSTPMPLILFLDLYLDEIHAGDNIPMQLADNGVYNYAVEVIGEGVMQLTGQAQGKIEANVLLNGSEVDRNLVWSSNKPFVTINNSGEYQVNGEVGDTAIITVALEGNEAVYDSIVIEVVEDADVVGSVALNPTFEKIREHETIRFNVQGFYNGQTYSNLSESTVSLADGEIVLSNNYLTIEKNGDNYTLTCNKRTSVPQTLYVAISNISPEFSANSIVPIELVSIMG